MIVEIKYHDPRKLKEEEVHFCLVGKKDKRPQGRFAMVAAAGSWESFSHLTTGISERGERGTR